MSGVKIYHDNKNAVAIDSRHGMFQLARELYNVESFSYTGYAPLLVIELKEYSGVNFQVTKTVNGDGSATFDYEILSYGHIQSEETIDQPLPYGQGGANIQIYDFAHFGDQPKSKVGLRLYRDEIAVFDSRKKPLEVFGYAYDYGLHVAIAGDHKTAKKLPDGRIGVVIPGRIWGSLGVDKHFQLAIYKTRGGYISIRRVSKIRQFNFDLIMRSLKSVMLVKM